ncbi:putative vacuolar protein sorting-associated protein 16 [Neolecta irregularis DAH-3]|uniref:Putative vacuolar protein sorting-associated protein 16 n=1 Tax=Neolecta irregularis (strain DAH-3) TaxID=1198029 RepID=A0A1U7LMD8_NEOID|nr:putative vacuolar protein sorting-associated protein 16 [Neolecta irregularis DAH-3]|eukprot:OLL23809.1 putative vacuolar protein sorting-associated protein 16 [Neolecta irregularis DAH-3]
MSPIAPPNTEWELLRDTFYRRSDIYKMTWSDLDLSSFTVVAAPHGGALALIRDESKTYTYPRIATSRPGILIYSSSGQLIERIPWDGKKICGSGWTNNEKLVIVTHDGTVRYYDLRGHFSQFSLGEDAVATGVHECQFWQSGLVALLRDGRYVMISNFAEPRPRMFATHGLTVKQIHCWAILPPQHTLSRQVEILIATRQTILVIDAVESQDQLLEQGPFSCMSVSPNGSFLALYSPEGKLWVVSTDFQRNLSEFDTGERTGLKQIAWCGDNSVILTWNNLLLMVGPFGGALRYMYDDYFWIFTDTDGLRIISQTKCEFLQRVPDYVEDVFKVGATSPAAVLLDAADQLDKKSAKADENVQIIRPHLTEAVETCIKAAGFEFSYYWQKQLLKAASFGKAFLDFYNSDAFAEMCDYLRVLNAVRNFEIGLSLTYEQFIQLGPENLIDRLLDRQQHLLALRISEHLRLPLDKVYIHWACMKIRVSGSNDDSVCRIILLDYESNPANQVPLLLSMKEDEHALKKAIESEDSDLVYFVLLELKGKMSLPQFFHLLNDKPVASRLFERLADEQNDKALLKDFFYQDDRTGDSAGVILKDGFEKTDHRERLDSLHLASKMFGEDKEHAFEAKVNTLSLVVF